MRRYKDYSCWVPRPIPGCCAPSEPTYKVLPLYGACLSSLPRCEVSA